MSPPAAFLLEQIQVSTLLSLLMPPHVETSIFLQRKPLHKRTHLGRQTNLQSRSPPDPVSPSVCRLSLGMRRQIHLCGCSTRGRCLLPPTRVLEVKALWAHASAFEGTYYRRAAAGDRGVKRTIRSYWILFPYIPMCNTVTLYTYRGGISFLNIME